MMLERAETISIREIDKRYTYANYRQGCALENCDRKASFWLTRSNQYYCQSDLVCSVHAQTWYEVKKLLENCGAKGRSTALTCYLLLITYYLLLFKNVRD